ncbi:Rieske (2Fe-2S) protein [Streptomyces apocyni]|uniref:Rieske (2Fe-2S) protein n=1 Tax=Streptomyces apocyni TaxID=2654677 RepID=UPI0012EAE6FA|nr:non-heme iron oxygenase ferredoxin subunit [Streptomyces apocyni]
MDIKEEIRVASLADVPEGELLSVELDGVQVLLARSGGTVFAVRDQCSHEDAPLSDGEIEDDGTVTCPWHFSRFCLRTGAALDAPAYDPIETYAVRVVDGEVLLSRAGGAGGAAR